MEFLKIVLFSTLAAIVYGILHDMVTAHVCVEYFSIAHPPVFPTTSPFLLALGWGVIAAWWVGLPLGLGAGLAARLGKANRQAWSDIRPLLLWLLAVMAGSALAAGIGGAVMTGQGHPVAPDWKDQIAAEHWIAFNFDAGAHLASYGVGIIGGWIVIALIVMRRFSQSAR